MDCKLTGSYVRRILQPKILEWVATPGDFPNPGIEPSSLMSPAFVGGFFTTRATWEGPLRIQGITKAMILLLNFADKKEKVKNTQDKNIIIVILIITIL